MNDQGWTEALEFSDFDVNVNVGEVGFDLCGFTPVENQYGAAVNLAFQDDSGSSPRQSLTSTTPSNNSNASLPRLMPKGAQYAQDYSANYERAADPPPTHPCQFPGCDVAFPTLGQLNRHKSQHADKEFLCKVAGCSHTTGFQDERDLYRHDLTVHKGIKPRCRTCNKLIYRKDKIPEHVKQCKAAIFDCTCGRVHSPLTAEGIMQHFKKAHTLGLGRKRGRPPKKKKH